MMTRCWACFAALIFALLIFEVGSSFVFPGPCLIQEMVKAQGNQAPQDNPSNNSCALSGGLVTQSILFVAEWKTETWTAVSTVVIAIFTTILGLFTISLAKSTRIAAEAADLSAHAAIAVNLPIIRIRPSKDGYGSSTRDGTTTHHLSVHALQFSNLGATKAFPTEVEYGWTVGKTLPSSPFYRRVMPFPVGHIFEPDPKVTPELFLPDAEVEIPETGHNQISAEMLSLWFYCRLSYLDFMETERTVGFCWKRVESELKAS
jgi:hypothetical protein